MSARACRPGKNIAFVRGQLPAAEHAAHARHIQFCRLCADQVEKFTYLQSALADSESWSKAPRPRRFSDVLNLLRRIEEWIEHAIPRLLARPPAEWHEVVASDGRYLAPTVVWQLLRHADQVCDDTPHEAIPIYGLATFVADEITRRCPVPNHEVRVAAWKDLAWVYRRIGDYTRAKDCLRIAAEAADACVDREKMNAIVTFARAGLYTSMGRLDEAIELIEAVRPRFAEWGDVERVEKCLEQEADVMMQLGRGDAALALLKDLVDLPSDDATRARRYRNISIALELTGQLDLASEFLDRAAAHHAAAGAKFLQQKDRWGRGRILAKQKRAPEAAEVFRDVANVFRELRVPDSAVRVDVELAELEISAGTATTETFTRLAAAASYALEHELPREACKALVYLQQLGGAVSSTQIRFVRSFLEDLSSHPHRRFIPPEAA